MLRILRELPGQRGAHYVSCEQLTARRDKRVRETVRFAAATVPYYRELFRRERIHARASVC